MADDEYRRLSCVDCGAGIQHRSGQGRPRIRCTGCSPVQAKPEAERLAARTRQATCPTCDAGFTCTLKGQTYCSDTCRVKAGNRRMQEKLRNSQPRSCRWCATVYVPEYGSLRTHYCTTECRDAAARKLRSGSTHRRRAAKFGCAYEPISKREVFERDGWCCYLCGCDTPKHLSGTTEPNAPELDHVVPLAKGGAHAWGNVRCACRRCNRAKADSLPTGQARTGQEASSMQPPPMVDAPVIDAPAPA